MKNELPLEFPEDEITVEIDWKLTTYNQIEIDYPHWRRELDKLITSNGNTHTLETVTMCEQLFAKNYSTHDAYLYIKSCYFSQKD